MGNGTQKEKRPAQTAVLKKETAMKPPKGAVVFIYGAPMDIPQTEPPLVRRQRAMGAPRRHGPEPPCHFKAAHDAGTDLEDP